MRAYRRHNLVQSRLSRFKPAALSFALILSFSLMWRDTAFIIIDVITRANTRNTTISIVVLPYTEYTEKAL